MRESLEEAMADHADRVASGLSLLPNDLKREIQKTLATYIRAVGLALSDLRLNREAPLDYSRGMIVGKALGTFSTGCHSD